MRLLNPETLRIVATVCKDSDFENTTVSRKSIIAHCWSEQLKFLASGKSHPKCFIVYQQDLGRYLRIVKHYGDIAGCNLNVENLIKYDRVYIGFCDDNENDIADYFDRDYLFSDCVSLYLKGVNIFPYVFGEDANKYIPIINLKEVHRIVTKTLSKDKTIEDEE